MNLRHISMAHGSAPSDSVTAPGKYQRSSCSKTTLMLFLLRIKPGINDELESTSSFIAVHHNE